MTDITDCLSKFVEEFNKMPTKEEYIIFVSDKCYMQLLNSPLDVIRVKNSWWERLKWKYFSKIKLKGAKISDVRFK